LAVFKAWGLPSIRIDHHRRMLGRNAPITWPAHARVPSGPPRSLVRVAALAMVWRAIDGARGVRGIVGRVVPRYTSAPRLISTGASIRCQGGGTLRCSLIIEM
jgi:hypothetical protein